MACRPNQWSKNLIVFLAPLFSFSFESDIWIAAVKSFIAFCMVSSSIYLINDSIDKNNDKKHPQKKFRIIASEKVSISEAVTLSIALSIISFLISFYLNIYLGFILLLYYIIQISYCFYLKNIPIIEFFCIAIGFIIRSIAGGVASTTIISYWFLLSIALLSLYLAIEKRKAEIINTRNSKLLTRKVLKNYSLSMFNKFEATFTSCLIMTYSLWSYGPMIGGSKSQWMMITIPLVLLGILRYQMISDNFHNNKDYNFLENPEKVIFIDKPIQIIVLSWLFITITIGLLS